LLKLGGCLDDEEEESNDEEKADRDFDEAPAAPPQPDDQVTNPLKDQPRKLRCLGK
jgi:hypothetical protein